MRIEFIARHPMSSAEMPLSRERTYDEDRDYGL